VVNDETKIIIIIIIIKVLSNAGGACVMDHLF